MKEPFDLCPCILAACRLESPTNCLSTFVLLQPFTLVKANGNSLFIVFFIFHVHMVGLFMFLFRETVTFTDLSLEGFVAFSV